MSATEGKKDGAAGAQSNQQIPNWYNNPAMNMYNMYNPYMYGNAGYGAQNYYQYFGGMQYGMQGAQQSGQQFRGFVPAGQMPFQPVGAPNQQIPPQQTQPATPNVATNDGSNDDLPPLPPGPPPPKGNNANVGQQPQNNFKNNAVIQSGPVKFMMNTPRPRMNFQGNAFNQQPNQQAQNAGGAVKLTKKQMKKKRAKAAKMMASMMQQQKQQKQFQWAQNQQNMDETPPLPDAPPPPLPPGSPPPPPPPPNTETNENHAGATNINLPPTPPVLPFQGLPPLPQAHPVKALEEWPASLREYVSKCYAKCVTQIDKDRVGVILKGKLIRATNDGTLWTKDWATEPLPLLDSDPKAMMNLKEKLNRGNITSRLGPKAASPNRKRSSLPVRGSGRSTYRSDSSSSRSSRSRSSSSSRRSRSRSPRSKRSSRFPNKKNRGNQNRRNNYNSKSHFYSEFGAIGGSEDLNVKKEVLDKRAARFNTTSASKPTLSSSISNRLGTKEPVGRKRHNPLFVLDSGPSSPQSNCPNGDYEVSDLHIIGTCEDLEKSYLRLTSAPEASQVRPASVLSRALEMVKAKWVQDRDYRYAFEQLKSIRQDLTVQGIRDALSVEVYETHARIAMEMKDHAEFNQCQSQLRILHNEVTDANQNQLEFKAYGVLYFILTKDCLELSTMISKLSSEDKKDECIKHAVELARSWLVGNHARLFKLYRTAPKMSSYLIDLFINRERIAYFKVLMKAYRPSLPVDFIKSLLEFNSDTDFEAFLTSVGTVNFVDASRTLIDCKTFQA